MCPLRDRFKGCNILGQVLPSGGVKERERVSARLLLFVLLMVLVCCGFRQLSSMDVSMMHFEPADFEKDQDLNFHMDFVTAASNMRAWNYR